MKKTILTYVMILSSVLSFAQKRDWGYVSTSLESQSHVYTEDVENTFATNNYFKLDYYNGRFSAGTQLEGYFPALVGYPMSTDKLSLSNLYLQWKDDSYSVTVGSFYDQLGSGLLFRSWEDRMLGLNNALWGARATYHFKDYLSVKAFWGVPRLGKYSSGKLDDNKRDFFGLGLTDVAVSAFDLSISLSELMRFDSMSLYLEGSVMNKKEKLDEMFGLLGLKENTLGWSGRLNMEYQGMFLKGEYIDAGLLKTLFGTDKGNAQLIEFGYNGRGLGLTVTGRRMKSMYQKIYSYTMTDPGYNTTANILSYRPAMCTQYTYMLTNLNPYNPEIFGEMGGQIDAFYNFRRGTVLGGKRGMRIHANYAFYNMLEDGGWKSGDKLFRDFSFDIEKQWSKSFKSTFLYSMQDYNKEEDGLYVGKSHIFVADLLYKFTRSFSARMELQYLASKDDRKDWMAALIEFSLAPHWSIFASDMYNHGDTRNHYYNAGLSYAMNHLRVSAGYGKYRAGYICSGGVCRAIPAYTGANISLTASF